MINNEFDNLLAKHFSGNITPAEQEKLDEMLKQGENRVAFQQAAHTWEMLGNRQQVEFNTDKAWEQFSDIVSASQAPRNNRLWIRIAAGVVLVASLITVFMFVMPDQPAVPGLAALPARKDPARKLVAAVQADTSALKSAPVQKKGRRHEKRENVTFVTVNTGDSARLYVLPDNSIVYLNVHSSLTYPSKFSTAEHAVTLQGEAFFDAARDAHPLVVYCGPTISSASGSAFNIKGYQGGTQVEVMLVSGALEFTANGKSAMVKHVLKAGHSISYNIKKETINTSVVRKKDKWWEKGGLRKRLSDFFHRLLGKTINSSKKQKHERHQFKRY